MGCFFFSVFDGVKNGTRVVFGEIDLDLVWDVFFFEFLTRFKTAPTYFWRNLTWN